VPVAELFGQPAPFTAVFEHIQNGVDNLKVVLCDIAPLPGKAAGNPVILLLSELHSGNIRKTSFRVNSVNTP
jgi:hypothetical protein